MSDTIPNADPTPGEDLVLIADSDAHVAQYLAERLRHDGFDTALARDGYQTLASIAVRRPSILIIERDIPFIDGLALTGQLRADPATASLPIVFTQARLTAAETIVALKTGADDVVAKPFDPAEVSARIGSAIRRHREVREASPLTGMPGNDRILREVTAWIRRAYPFALAYIDIDNFKAVNDVYGFVRGDEFIRALAEATYSAAADSGAAPVFLGHVGGDDFAILARPDDIDATIRFLIGNFRQHVIDLADDKDVEVGYIDFTDRNGNPARSALPTLSIGVALSTKRNFADAHEAVAEASNLKGKAKSHIGDYIAYSTAPSDTVHRPGRPVFWSR
ncbi:GGDEF domain-containing response regulator [Haloglycomyces albus]|uniref:GGDEF domain-containing response regulator n=1 Tax=Haloglycomyces albus TaxID=526067 RepID=UPI00046CE3D2|nr:response regulator [Haloglycomyces albus]